MKFSSIGSEHWWTLLSLLKMLTSCQTNRRMDSVWPIPLWGTAHMTWHMNWRAAARPTARHSGAGVWRGASPAPQAAANATPSYVQTTPRTSRRLVSVRWWYDERASCMPLWEPISAWSLLFFHDWNDYTSNYYLGNILYLKGQTGWGSAGVAN